MKLITDRHRIEFGLFDKIKKNILKGDANVTLTYVNRSQEILIVEITMDISTSNFTMITLTCGSDHVSKSITVPSKYYINYTLWLENFFNCLFYSNSW